MRIEIDIWDTNLGLQRVWRNMQNPREILKRKRFRNAEQHISVGTATRYGVDGQGIEYRMG
jgi:hypothetical protein